MKIYSSIHEVQIEDILILLTDWEQGRVSREDVFTFAEGLFYLEKSGCPQYPASDSPSILFAVLQSLELMYSQPTLEEDILALKRCLQIGLKDALDAWAFIHAYWDTINWQERLNQ